MKTNNTRTDKDTLGFISTDLKTRYSWISDVSYDEIEDYKIDLTLDTSYGSFPAEVKTSRSHDIKDAEGNWNPYYSTSRMDGILRYSLTEIPESMKGKHVYMINASTKGERAFDPRCKYCQLMSNNAILIYITRGGYLVWDPNALRRSLLGFIWVRCYHTEDFRLDNKQDKELKALFCFEDATYIKTDVPEFIF